MFLNKLNFNLRKLLKINNTFSKFPYKFFSQGEKKYMRYKKIKDEEKVRDVKVEQEIKIQQDVKFEKNEKIVKDYRVYIKQKKEAQQERYEENVIRQVNDGLKNEKQGSDKENTDTINIQTVEENSEKNQTRRTHIKEIYDIPSKKLGAKDPSKFIDASRFENKNFRLSIFNEEKFFSSIPDFLIPVSPRLGPYEVINPQLEGKTYHWCACGMSNKQPFCDGSHRNGKIRPISFKLGEKVDSMLLCGCKLSTKKPFCDRRTCLSLSKKEEEEINKILTESNQEI
jgi:CDGSH-type Zn-finger protein